MRGERYFAAYETPEGSGSSPHARGTLVRPFTVLAVLRFIPACAGNARQVDSVTGIMSVHPRMRGERRAWTLENFADYGSSPHARGTHFIKLPKTRFRRFIPACAGNAPVFCTPGCPGSVHPRMRGERRHAAPVWRRDDGSSPHGRGTRPVRS